MTRQRRVRTKKRLGRIAKGGREMSKNITAPSDRQLHTVGTCSLRERRWRVARLECEWPVEANPGVAQPVSAPP